MKAGWLALFLFVWIIGAFLGSTFEYQSTSASSGMSYAVGTANFTTGSANVSGAGTTWNNVLMANGLMKCNANGLWYKIASVNSTTLLNLTAVYAGVNATGGNLTSNAAYTMQASPGWAGTGTGGYGSSPTTKLEYLLNVSNAIQRISLLGVIPFPVPNGEYFNTAYEVITWRWSFMVDYGMFYWVFCAPFVVMGVLSMLLLVYGILTGNLTF